MSNPDPYPEHTKLAKIMDNNPLSLFLANLDSGEFCDDLGRSYRLVVMDGNDYPWPVNIERAQYDLLGVDYNAYMAEFDQMIDELKSKREAN